MARATRRRSKKTFSVPDLSKVEGRILVPEGEYAVKVVEVTQEQGEKADYFAWIFEVFDDKKYDGAKLYYNTSLSDNSLWNLKTLLEALQYEIPDDAFELDPEEMVDLEMMAVVEHEKYDGKMRAKIVDFAPLEAPEPARGGRKTTEKPARGGSKPKEVVKVSQEEINGMNQDELEDLIKEHDLEVDLSKLKTPRRMRAAVIDAAEKADILED